MKVRFIGKDRQVYDVDGVAELVVMTDQGDPVSVSQQSASGIITSAHAADKDFEKILGGVGMRPSNIVVVGGD